MTTLLFGEQKDGGTQRRDRAGKAAMAIGAPVHGLVIGRGASRAATSRPAAHS
jgi:hypothetical protein